jgi:sugar/nucleoside kinase (ribokinase family)
MPTLDSIPLATAANLRRATPTLKSYKALIGLDGFVDEIIAVVDQRTSPTDYTPLPTIARLGDKIRNAAGQSSNYELVVKQQKLGGNGTLMANALAAVGMDVTYVGSLGLPAPHPVFQDLVSRCSEAISIADPGHTDALEFSDGKLMLGKLTPLNDVNWPNLLAHVGQDRLTEFVRRSSLVAMNNWTMLTHMSDIWSHLQTDVLPHLPRENRRFFVDLADPEKRSREDLHGALQLLTGFQSHADVTLGLNLKESQQISTALGLAPAADTDAAIEQSARAIRGKLDLACVVIHPRRGAAAATANESAWFTGPFTFTPKISTGAGDHFNAGFALAQTLGLPLDQSLCTACATSGYYVRHALSPTADQLADFLEHLPTPQS